MDDAVSAFGELLIWRVGLIDSTGDGVQARNLQKLFYDDECAVHALRPKSPLSPAALKQVIDYARAATGTPYSFIEAVRAFKGPRGEGMTSRKKGSASVPTWQKSARAR